MGETMIAVIRDEYDQQFKECRSKTQEFAKENGRLRLVNATMLELLHQINTTEVEASTVGAVNHISQSVVSPLIDEGTVTGLMDNAVVHGPKEESIFPLIPSPSCSIEPQSLSSQQA